MQRNHALPTTILLALLLFGLPLAAADEPAAPSDADAKPNIVFVLTDQWRASATGYAGDPNVKTPNLDRLARQGLNFRNAVSVLPVCTPYRAALMTGRYPTSTGMFLNDAYLPADELCMAEIFEAASYATAYIGKWHLDGHGRDAFIPPERRQGWQYWKVAECDHNYPRSHYYAGNSEVKRFWEGYDAFAQTRDAQQYLRRRAVRPQPFLLLVSYGVPHFPHHTALDEYKALYPPETIELPPNVPEKMQARARQEAQGYYAHCTALDRCVGDLLTTLDELGMAENTIFVFTSDHGEMLGSHGGPPFKKHVAWSESAHVPFLLRFPAVQRGRSRTFDTPLTTPDILPTLLGLAGVAVPDTVEGDDLSPLVRDLREADDRAALYMAVAPWGREPEFNREYRAIRTSRYTYVRSLDGPWLLYDDRNDPYQLNNLAENPQYAALREQLDERLQQRLDAIGDTFRPAAHYVERWGYTPGAHGSVPYRGKEVVPQSPRLRPSP